MRLLRLLAAALLLVPSAQTARAAQRVVSVPVELPRVQIQAPQLPNLALSPVVPVLPSVSIPVAPAVPQELAPQAANVSAIAQAQAAVPQEPGRAPEQTAAAAFDGSAPMPRMDALRPYRAGGAQKAVVGLTVLGWGLLAGAGATIATSGAFSSALVSFGSIVPALIMARPVSKWTPAEPDPRPTRATRALVKRAQRLVDVLVLRAGYDRSVAPKVQLSNSEGKDNAWANGKLDGKGTIGVGQAYARVGDETLSGVLAHELGHLVHGDSGSAFGQAEPAARYGKFAAAWALFAAAGALVVHQTWGDAGVALTMTGAAALAAGLGAALVAKASRLVERRADRFGAWLTSTRWMAKGFRRDQRSEKPMGVVDRIYSTHGPAAERARFLRRDERTAPKLPKDDDAPVEALLVSPKPLETWRSPFLLSVAERALKRFAVPTFVLATVLPMMVHDLAGLTGVAAAYLYWFFKTTEKKEEPRQSTLSEQAQSRLIARGDRVLRLLTGRLGLRHGDVPRVALSNAHGKGNASVAGRSFGTAIVHLGDGWSDRTNRQLAAVLAHELGHIVHRDGASPLDHVGAVESLAHGLSLASLGALVYWELTSVFLARDFTYAGLILRVMAAVAVPLLAWMGAAALKGASRLRERRADRFAAWLTHPRWLAEFFERLPDHNPWLKTHPTPSARVDALAKQAVALGRNPPAGGPKGPGRKRGSSLK